MTVYPRWRGCFLTHEELNSTVLYLNENGEIAEDDHLMKCRECGHVMNDHWEEGCMVVMDCDYCPCSYREVPCGTP
jgi:hypothetical protein